LIGLGKLTKLSKGSLGQDKITELLDSIELTIISHQTLDFVQLALRWVAYAPRFNPRIGIP
jgi:hypothetical protein